MKIYTKTGDQGETGLFGGPRVRKSHPRIKAYGAVDELNALLGQVRSFDKETLLDKTLKRIQNNLFVVGALLASPQKEKLSHRGVSNLPEPEIRFLEETIDRHEADLPPLTAFILPDGNQLASLLHLARTVCRRAEREVVSLAEEESVDAPVIVYLNRLSDLLFVLARWINKKSGVLESPWEKQRE